jgi:probable rRNA maturation factor
MPVSQNAPVFFFFKKPVSLRNRTNLKKFILSVFKKEDRKLDSLNIIFCSDKEILDINRKWLSHNYYTDIITFELSPKGDPVAGDIYISSDRVKENAQNLGVSLKSELHRVIFHGVLHLCGYKDKKFSDQKEMREKENVLLSMYKI